MAISGTHFDEKKVQKFMRELRRNEKDVLKREREYVQSLMPEVYNDIIDHFKKQKGPDGKWPNWVPWYIRWQQKRKPKRTQKRNMLKDTGHLRQGIQFTNWRLRRKGIEVFNPAKTAKGVPYAKIHDEGGWSRIGRGKGRKLRIKQRKFMWLSDGAMNRISIITAAWLAYGKGKGK